jgi:hypothetical protein
MICITDPKTTAPYVQLTIIVMTHSFFRLYISLTVIMRSLHAVHKMKSKRANHVCLSVCLHVCVSVRMIQLENSWTDFD